eukprot:3588683-Pleurochrysis_carterae.AAC.1
MVRERRRRGAGSTYEAALVRDVQRVARRPCASEGSRAWVSGARALRKYACDANAIRETMHVSAKLRQTATVSGIEPHGRVKRSTDRLEPRRQNGR